jgi:mannose-1-phosphate guanylyltransferase / mannose-6-phosphate isomerase
VAGGNVIVGSGEVLFDETRNSFAYTNHALVAVVGLKDVVVSATEDAVLVISKEYAESVNRRLLLASGTDHGW